MNCIFCSIANGTSSCHKLWEDENYLAVLSIFPNTEGFSVVFPKIHAPSYAFDLPDRELFGLVHAAKRTGLMLDRAFDNVARTGMILEGYGVDHVHAKLFPMHGTADQKKWKAIKSNVDKYFERYEGYISSHDHMRADDQDLAMLAVRIIDANR